MLQLVGGTPQATLPQHHWLTRHWLSRPRYRRRATMQSSQAARHSKHRPAVRFRPVPARASGRNRRFVYLRFHRSSLNAATCSNGWRTNATSSVAVSIDGLKGASGRLAARQGGRKCAAGSKRMIAISESRCKRDAILAIRTAQKRGRYALASDQLNRVNRDTCRRSSGRRAPPASTFGRAGRPAATRSLTPTNSRIARVPASPRRGLASRKMRV